MLKIRCAHCHEVIFKYVKVGKGRLWHLWKGRIVQDLSVHDGTTIKCPCGKTVGVDEGKWIKLKQHAITYTGARLK
jgi:hypothetical protein